MGRSSGPGGDGVRGRTSRCVSDRRPAAGRGTCARHGSDPGSPDDRQRHRDDLFHRGEAQAAQPRPDIRSSRGTNQEDRRRGDPQPLLDINPDERDMLLNTLAAFFAFQGSAIEAGKHLYCPPTRCATGCAGSSVIPAARCKTPDRQRNYSSPWRRYAGCQSRPVATSEADRIRRRRSAR